jgi:hypothetical protein
LPVQEPARNARALAGCSVRASRDINKNIAGFNEYHRYNHSEMRKAMPPRGNGTGP